MEIIRENFSFESLLITFRRFQQLIHHLKSHSCLLTNELSELKRYQRAQKCVQKYKAGLKKRDFLMVLGIYLIANEITSVTITSLEKFPCSRKNIELLKNSLYSDIFGPKHPYWKSQTPRYSLC